ncbi:uncharacterized protein RJT20DRAFT_54777 [Scheffersomyces xylosifermentans]|uniref:uncharacterized protein n=1 Tax=Scheffersomyces xylosifermentans TaxID=1304137 RepID=UPI00315C58C0
MIVLPNTPPLPTAFKSSSSLPPSLQGSRASLAVPTLSSYHDSIRYAVNLEHYLEEIIRYVYNEVGTTELSSLASFSAKTTIVESPDLPWSNIQYKNTTETKKRDKLNNVFKSKSNTNYTWTLENEVEMVLVAISFVYNKIGSELTNELIDSDTTPSTIQELNEKWKQVVNFYKKAISYTLFGAQLNVIASESLNATIYTFLQKVSEINIQMSILAKSSWINRNEFEATETFTTTNNGTLCRVAIYILNELRTVKGLLVDLESSSQISLNYKYWQEYLTIIEKYASSYAGFFLAVENYQQEKLGQAIGLVHFSLLNLQSKSVGTDSKKLKDKFKTKISTRRNEHLLSNLNSISTLDINKSVFNEKSGIVLNDISYLFDQLIRLNLKLEKENNTLKFDEIVKWQEINKDSKWPLGNKIPVSDIKTYDPVSLVTGASAPGDSTPKEYSGRGAYY